MAGSRYDLTRANNVGVDHPLEQGATFQLTVGIQDDGVDRPLVGHVARIKLLEAWGGTVILSSASDTDPSEWTLVTGSVGFKYSDENTGALTTRSDELAKELGSDRAPGVYSMELEDADGDIEVLLYGEKVEVVPMGS